MFRIKHFTLTLGQKPIFHEAEYVFREKRGLIALIAPSGSGKTSLFRSLASGGSNFEINGKTVRAGDVAFLPQTPSSFANVPAKQSIQLHAKLSQNPDFELCRTAKELRLSLETLAREASTLSGGERQRVVLAGAFAMESKPIVLLDEPTDGLDPSSRSQVLEIIQRIALKSLVLISSHQLPELDALGIDDAIFVKDCKLVSRNARSIGEFSARGLLFPPNTPRAHPLLGLIAELPGCFLKETPDGWRFECSSRRSYDRILRSLRVDRGLQSQFHALYNEADHA